MSRDGLFWIVLALIAAALVFLVANDIGSLGFDGDRLAGIAYLGILGLVIGVGVLASRRRGGGTLRMAAGWLAIVLALVAGYEYRYELQDVASRVTAGLVPGSPLSAFDAEGRATVTLTKRPDGHFGARVIIDGAPVDMLVDTGATSTVLTVADAARAGFDTAKLRFVIPVSTANGQALAARVVGEEVAVGAISRRSLPLLVAADGALRQSLLGMNFIGSLSGFDVRGDRLILRD